MKLRKIAAVAAASVMALSAMSMSVCAEEVDLDGTYHAYLGVQSASYTFRNAYDEATYGYGITADDGTVWFDQLTGWDGPTALNKGGNFTDVEIAGNGTYSVSVTDFDFGDDESFNLLFVSSDIPLNDDIKISDVKVVLDGQSKYTFDEAYMSPDSLTYMNWMAINIWNDDLGGADGLFGYMMPQDSIEIQFTVSGFNYDFGAAPAAEAEEAVTEAAPEAAPVADTTTTSATTGNTSAAALAGVMAIAAAAAFAVKKSK